MYCAVKNVILPVKENLTLNEKPVLKDLQNDHSILILKADKIICTVVMNATDNDNKIHEMLEDETT